MVRYLKQQDEFRCGPVLLLNLMKWLGMKSWKGHRINKELADTILTKLCKCYVYGTDDTTMHSLLSRLPIKAIFRRKFDLQVLDDHLESSARRSVILGYLFTAKDSSEKGHYALIVEKLKNSYVIINYEDSFTHENIKTVDIISKKRIQKVLSKEATCWLVTKSS